VQIQSVSADGSLGLLTFGEKNCLNIVNFCFKLDVESTPSFQHAANSKVLSHNFIQLLDVFINLKKIHQVAKPQKLHQSSHQLAHSSPHLPSPSLTLLPSHNHKIYTFHLNSISISTFKCA
jgi:hypothetical protein